MKYPLLGMSYSAATESKYDELTMALTAPAPLGAVGENRF